MQTLAPIRPLNPLLASLVPAKSDRALFVGQTGSGKTTLARVLLEARRYVVVLDAKGTIKWPGYRLEKNLDRLVKRAEPRLIYRPTMEELVDESTIDSFFRWIYLRRNTTVYIDETAAITRGDVYPFHYGACFMRGRELNVEVWSATQRPTRIPQVALSESEHVYAFRLRLPQDRMRVEALTGISQDAISGLTKRNFLYAPQSGEVAGPFTLSFDS